MDITTLTPNLPNLPEKPEQPAMKAIHPTKPQNAHIGNAHTREYFYTIDEQGRLWHDGSELTDAHFVDFFFRRLQPNTTSKHPQYSFVSPCGNEMNYVRPHDTPIVFHRISADGQIFFAATLSYILKPEYLAASTEGLLYHPAPVGGYGRLSAYLLAELAQNIETTSLGQYVLTWHETKYIVPVCERSLLV